MAHSWFNRFRKILVRFEKKKSSFESLLQLAEAIIIYRKLGIIYGKALKCIRRAFQRRLLRVQYPIGSLAKWEMQTIFDLMSQPK